MNCAADSQPLLRGLCFVIQHQLFAWLGCSWEISGLVARRGVVDLRGRKSKKCCCPGFLISVLCNHTEQKGISSYWALSYQNEPVMLRQAAQASCSQLSPSLWCIPARGASAAPWRACPGLGWPIPMLNPNLPWLSLSSNQSSAARSLSPCHQWWLQQRPWRSKETMQRPLLQNSGQRQTWESCKRRPWRRCNLNTCCSGSEPLSYKHFDAVACVVPGQMQKWEMGHFFMSDTSQGVSQRQNKGKHQPKGVGLVLLQWEEQQHVSFFLKAFWKLPPKTQWDSVSLFNNHAGKCDFPFLDFWQH